MTADRGWVVAGQLAPGERVQRADGTTARVVALRAVAGVGPMWDLTLDAVHTFAVGDGAYVVHNCGSGNSPDDPANAEVILQRMKEGVRGPNKGGSIFARTNEADKAARSYVAEGGAVNEMKNAEGPFGGYSEEAGGAARWQYRYDMENRAHGDAPHINLQRMEANPAGRFSDRLPGSFNLHIYLVDWD